MTSEFNLRPPVNSPLTDRAGNLSADWQAFYRQLFQFFQTSFTPQLVLLPSVNTDELSGLATSQKGSLTYNAETDEFQALKTAGWKTITTS